MPSNPFESADCFTGIEDLNRVCQTQCIDCMVFPCKLWNFAFDSVCTVSCSLDWSRVCVFWCMIHGAAIGDGLIRSARVRVYD